MAQGYAATLYSDGDEFGMLGGWMRVVAAKELYRIDTSRTFLFSTGVSAKQIARFGPDVPPEARIYRDDFLLAVANDARISDQKSQPTILLEESSVNTFTNLMEVVKVCKSRCWERAAVVTSDYHVPRVAALYSLVSEHYDLLTQLEFLGAERIVRYTSPGVYDAEVNYAYSTQEGQKRLRNEKKGLDHIQSGEYVLTEYQLAG